MFRFVIVAAILTIPGLCLSIADKSNDSNDSSVEGLPLTSPVLDETLSCTSVAEPCEEVSGADRMRIQESFGSLPLYFIENHGQMDDEVAFYVKGADKTVYFTPSGITFAITKRNGPSSNRDLFSIEKPGCRKEAHQHDDAMERWIVKMEFVGANQNVMPRGENKQEAVFSYFRGKPEEWNTGIPTYSRMVYENLWPGIDLVYYGTVNQLKYDFIVKPGADPDTIRFAVSGASDVVLEDSGIIQIKTPLGCFEDEKPTAYQVMDGTRSEVPVKYSLDRSEKNNLFSLGFEVGDYDPRGALVIDPAILVYCGYIGGSSSERNYTYGIAVDHQGNAYVTGCTYSSETGGFPVKVGPDLSFNGNGDAFVAKVAASGSHLEYCGYIGGSEWDEGFDIAVDGQGNAYVFGDSESSEDEGFPVKVGPDLTYNNSGIWIETDAFIAKVSAMGDDLLYCGYIGGTETEFGESIAVDEQGNAYVTGYTGSSETGRFPVKTGPDLTFNGNGDAFVAKVAAAGAHLEYCGYIGGSDNDEGAGIELDGEGNVYVTGYTYSSQGEGFPVLVGPDLTFNGGYDDFDAFVTKVAATGTHLEYCGYIGGKDEDFPRDIAVDGEGNAYVTGETYSSQSLGFPVLVGPDLTFNSGYRDAFVAKVAVSGAELIYCGYIGGGDWTNGHGIAVDQYGNAYVAGRTYADEGSFPVLIGPDLTHNGWVDGFVAKVVATSTHLEYCGYIGGWGWDEAFAIALDKQGNAYVAGMTESSESTFPVKVGPDLTYNGGSYDAFVAKVVTIGLYCDKYSLSASTTATVDFNLLASQKNASNKYLLAAGISGSSPGVTLPTGLVLPLNWDFISDLSVLLNNTAFFFDFMGTLDAEGSASARFEWPGIPGSAGMSLYFAFCTWDPDEGFNYVSNPVEIELVP